jgi:hypothetical protein
MISAFKNLSLFTTDKMAQDCEDGLHRSQSSLVSTRKCLEKVNFLFSNNYALDASFVNEFLTLRQLLTQKRISSYQTKKLDGLIHILQLFVQKNNAYFLNKNPITKADFHDTFIKLKEMHRFILQEGYASLFHGLMEDLELDSQFTQITGISLMDFIQKVETTINHGLDLYLRQDNFEEFKSNKLEILNIELAEIHLACSMLDNLEIKQKSTQLDLKIKALSQGIQENDNQKIEWVLSYEKVCLLMKELQSCVKEAVIEKEPVFLSATRPLIHQFELSEDEAAYEEAGEKPKTKSLRFNNFL